MYSRVDPLPPFGTDSSHGPSYFSYGASSSSSSSLGAISRPLPFSAGSYNGGLIAPTSQAQLAAATPAANYSRFGGAAKQIVNPISWRSTQSGSSRLNNSSILSKSSTLPSVPGAIPSPSPSPVSQPFINQSGDSVSRARTAQGQPPGSFNPTTAVPPPTQPTQTRFHRTRSSFIPNKWTRGPGDGTFGSVYLSFGGGGDYNRNSALSFDRKRPEEIWEEEQARKHGMSQSTKKRSKPKTKKKEKRPQGKDAATRKLLAKARNQLLAHLSAPSCRLFSEADHVVAVSDDDLDDLLHAGGGDVNMVIDYLTQFDRDNKKFDTFQQLMVAIQDARKEDGDFGAGTEQDQYESQDQGQGQGQDHLEDEPMQQPEPDNEYPPDEEEKTAENETHRSDEFASSSAQPVSKKSKKREPAAVEKRPAKKAEEDEAKRKTTNTRNAPAAPRTTKTNEDKKRKDQTTSTLKKKPNSTVNKKEATKPAEESKEDESTTESATDPTTTATATTAETESIDTQHETASDPTPSADPLESPATQPEPTPPADSSSDTPAAAVTAISAEPDSSYTPPAEAATTVATDDSTTSEPAANQDPDESYGDDFD